MKDYRFKLSYSSNGVTVERYANAIFGDGLALEVAPDAGEMYHRNKLTGNITFVNEDYDFIMNAPIDAKIIAVLENWEHQSWRTYIECYFYRTDCEVNEDDRIISVEMSTSDQYDEFLGVLDKEVDLIKLAPKITPIMLDKRPCLQLYARGADSVTCVLSNISWEQDCEAVDNADDLTSVHHFALWGSYVSAGLIGSNLPSGVPLYYAKQLTDTETESSFRITSGSYRLEVYEVASTAIIVYITQGNTILWRWTGPIADWGIPATIEMTGYNGNPDCKLELDLLEVYGRIISDADAILGVDTAALDANDLVGNNRNYKRVSPAPPRADLALGMSGLFSSTPTEWGYYQEGEYYTPPYVIGGGEFVPVLRNQWGRVSYWIEQSTALDYVDQTGRKTVTLKDAYRLVDVINAILAELMPGMTVQSNFIDRDPLNEGEEGRLYITPKSNVLNINYTEPAQKAPITLKQILDMLRVVYRCYWQLSGTSTLRIEHVEWFRRGGSYDASPSVAVDLTANATVRNGKQWSYLTSKYKFDKQQMPIRYEFGWMDDQSEPFDGWPLEMLSGYVDKTRIEKLTAGNFSADVDYLMLNPSGVSKDGFVLLKAGTESITVGVAASGTNSYAVLTNYETNAPETIWAYFDYAVTGTPQEGRAAIEILAFSKAGKLIDTITTRERGQLTDAYQQWTIPANTAMIVVHFTEIGGSFTLNYIEPPTEKVLYYNWKYNEITDHWLQNGVLAFVYLNRFYAYDMPCRKYRIGTGTYAEDKTAIGVAKNKVQDVIYPTSGYVEPEKVVKTNLGNGKVQKLTLNLSSKMAETTLCYDTE